MVQGSPGVGGEPTTGEQFGRALTAADFDRDGYADLAALTCNQIAIGHGSPTGLTSRSVFLTTPLPNPPCGHSDGNAGLSGVVAGDFNGDSRTDLVAGSRWPNRVFVYPGTDTGFSPTPALDFAKAPPTGKDVESGEVGNSLASGDITGDGIDDLAVGTGLGQIDSTMTGTSSIGGFYFVPGSSSGLQPDRRRFIDAFRTKGLRPKQAQLSDAFGHALVIADFDHDGFGDVAVGDPESGFDR